MPATSVRFVLVGACNTLLGLAVIYLLKWAFGVGDIPANIAGYAVGLCVSYLLNARWTFAYRGSLLSAAHRFLVTVGAAYLANLSVVGLAVYVLRLDGYLAQALGVIPYAAVTYFGSKLFVFRQHAQPLAAGSAGSQQE